MPESTGAAPVVWIEISNIMQAWTQRILDVDTEFSRTSDLQQLIGESLQRQLLDGLLSDWEVNELKYVGGLWADLSNTVSCYSLGARGLKGRLISILLELYSMKQIDRLMFIDICSTL